jgi:CRISPR-associated protein, Cas02710 family
LLMCFFVLGLHYEHIGRRDFAALLFYRTIEGCFARRLELGYRGFDCENPQYDLLGVDTLEQRYLGLDLGGRPERSLPASVGLMAAAKLLFICDDEFVKSSKLDTLRALASLRDLTSTRNRSVLAHGHQPIAAADTAVLRNRARDLLSRFWRLHGTGEEFRQLCDQLRFIDSDR